MKVWTLVVVSAMLIAIAILGVWPSVENRISAGELSSGIGFMGLYLGLLSLGFTGLASALSIHSGDEHHKELSKKIEDNARKLNTIKRQQWNRYKALSNRLDTITSRQEDLISLVQSSSLHSTEEAQSLDSLTNSVDSIEAAIDRVRNSLNSDKRP